jgi:hypothetical protein
MVVETTVYLASLSLGLIAAGAPARNAKGELRW